MRRLRRARFADSTGRPLPPDRSQRRVTAVRPTGLRTVAARAIIPSEAEVVAAACIGRSPAAPPNSRSSPAHMCRTRPGRRAWRLRIAGSTGRPTPPDRSRPRTSAAPAGPPAPSASTAERSKIPARRPPPDRGLPPRAGRPARGRSIARAVAAGRMACRRRARNATPRSASQARSRIGRVRQVERSAP
jgi:hypothetical protein